MRCGQWRTGADMGICFSAGDVSSGLLIFSAMQQEDDLKALENIVQFARGLGVFFLVLHVYWYLSLIHI